MIHVLNALEKMAAWMIMVSSGGSPLGGAMLARGAMADLAMAHAEAAAPADAPAKEPEPPAAEPDNSANEANKAEADANETKAAEPQQDHS